MNKKKKTLVSLFMMAMLAFGSVSLVSATGYDFGNVDLGGQTIRLVAWHDLLEVFEEGNDREGELQEIEAQFNVKIEALTIPWDDYVEGLMSRLLSGDSSNDIWLMTHQWFFEMVPRDPFLPVNDVVTDEYYELLAPSHRNTYEVMSYRNNNFGLSSYGNIFGAMRFMGFNRDMLEREGLEDIYELYQNGEWTWEKATEMARAATRDTDGDGEIDQWGMSTLWTSGFMLANDGKQTRVDDDGKILFAMDDERIYTALTQMYEWEHVDQVLIGGDWGGDQFAAGKVLMQPLEAWRFEHLNMEDRYGIVPKPKGPHAEDYRFPQLQLEALMLPKNAANPLGLIAVADALFPREVFEIGMEDSYANVAPDRTAYEVVRRGVETWTGEMTELAGIVGPIVADAIEAALDGEKSPAVAIGEVKEAAQAALDDVFEQ